LENDVGTTKDSQKIKLVAMHFGLSGNCYLCCCGLLRIGDPAAVDSLWFVSMELLIALGLMSVQLGIVGDCCPCYWGLLGKGG
jgi:hypothetical protein